MDPGPQALSDLDIPEPIIIKLRERGVLHTNQLPNTRDTTDWNIIENLCNISPLELIPLKNALFPVPPQQSLSSSQQQGTVTLESLLESNVKKLGKINPNVVSRMRKRLGNGIIQAVTERNAELAYDLYQSALDLPQTSTIECFRVKGYSLNGPYLQTELTIVYTENLQTCIMKFLNGFELKRGNALLEAMGSDTTSVDCTGKEFITSFSIVSVESAQRKTDAMIMPFYPTTLESIPELNHENCVKLLTQLTQALEYLHRRGFAYMDMKPSNICLNGTDAVLIDLGSVAKFGEKSSCTQVYLPQDLQSRTGEKVASAEIDWWMLMVTFLEKSGKIDIGGAKATPKTVDIYQLFASLNLGMDFSTRVHL